MMLLSGRPKNVSGTCVACVMEGTRPILAEVQGLATSSGFGNPRRMSTGFDYNRMSLLLAVLEKRAGYFFSNLDAYLNVVGGLRLDEPAADLAVAMALVSSLKDVPVSENALAFGEIGLAGEIRSVNHAQARVNEASRLGFQRCVLPYHNLKSLSDSGRLGLELIGVKSVREAFEALAKLYSVHLHLPEIYPPVEYNEYSPHYGLLPQWGFLMYNNRPFDKYIDHHRG